MNKEFQIKTSVLKIGNVISVDGRVVKVNVDKSKNASHLLYMGDTIKNVSVGSYIKIAKGFEEIVGKIDGEFITEEKSSIYKDYKDEKARIKRILNVSLIGFFSKGCFERGIKELPLIDNECFLLDEIEFCKVHDFIKDGDDPLEIGHLAQEKSRKITVGVNSLFASHIGIFGNTGSGKSYTLAKIYRQLFLKYINEKKFGKKAAFFLIDFNGEYVGETKYSNNVIIENKFKNTFRLNTRSIEGDKFPLPEEMLNDPIIWMIVLEATEKTQTPFIRRSLISKYIEDQVSSNEKIKEFIFQTIKAITTYKDRSIERGLIINFLYDIKNATENFSSNILKTIKKFDSYLQFNNKHNEYYFDYNNTDVYSSQDLFKQIIKSYLDSFDIDITMADPIEKIHLKFIFNYYDEIVKGYSNKEHIAPLIKRLDRRISELVKVITINKSNNYFKRNITIVSLKDVNIHMRKILPLLFCKQLYEGKKAENDKSTYLNIIIDEAHNILSSSSQRESEQWKDYRLETFEEIIKEGRKFGVFLTIASQRPYDVSPTIISQLHNYFLHRLINNNDIQAIEKTVSFLDKVSFESLTILPTGTCIVAGLVAQVPIIVEIEKIEEKFRPFNQTITPVKFWKKS